MKKEENFMENLVAPATK